MKSYNNDPEFKKKAVEAAIRHREMDMLMPDTYGKYTAHGFKGCSIGCDAFDITGNIPNSPHKVTAKYFGFPEWLERLRDSIFEGLERADRVNWHVDIKKAIPIGMNEADFDQVKKDFLIWLMEQNIKVVEGLNIERVLKGITLSAIHGVIEALEIGEGLEEAKNAAMAASEAVAGSEVGRAVRAANYAMVTVTAASATSAARAANYKKQSDKLIELFESYKAQKS